nr:SCO family protein [Granulicella sp. dw_53]
MLLSGCHSSKPAPSQDATQSSGPVKTYPIRGKVVSTTGTSILLDHEAVPGFMEAMTMSYKLKDPSIISELHPGDRITATLLVTKDPDGFNTILLDKIVVIAQSKPDYKPAVQYHVPEPGDVVPDFKLTNQGAHPIHIAQFKGRVLLITFIYTRCPLADFCPRMSRNFADVDKALAVDPALYAKTHLLSISFDPAYDTPKVLRSYGQAYIGQSAKDAFAHWDFAVPRQDDLATLTQYFNVGITAGDSQTITHSLSTILIGKDGKVAAWYPDNDWKPAEMIALVKKAAIA